jgi:hypothetical protein
MRMKWRDKLGPDIEVRENEYSRAAELDVGRRLNGVEGNAQVAT